MFEVKGIINKKEYTLKYSGGILTGDEPAIEKTRVENYKNHGYLGLAPDDINKNYLQSETAAADLIIRFVFETVTEEKNDWPEWDPDAIY